MTREIRFNVGGDPKDDQPLLYPDRPEGHAPIPTSFEGPGRLLAVIPPECTGGATLKYQKESKEFRIILPPVDHQFQNEAGEPPQLPPEYNGDPDKVALHYKWAPKLLPWVRNGQFYYQQDGSPVTIKQASGFRLYERLLRGENVDPFLADLQAVGFNCVRVWLLNTSVGHILPSEHPDFYQRLPELIDKCAEFGIVPELTLFTQTQTLMPSLAQQQAHYDACVNAIGTKYCLVEGVNENDSHDNAIDPNLRFWKPAGAIFDLCRGSNGSDAWAVEPVLESARYHSNDANEWWRRQAHNGMEIADAFHVPCLANENTRPDHDGNPLHHHDAAAGAALLSCGSCFHSTSGKDAVPFSPQDRPCAEAFIQGANSMDLTQRVYGYIHRTDLENSQVLRAYQRGSQVVLIHY